MSNNTEVNTIDFVIPWVDGNDPAWQAEKSRYTGNEDADERLERYRDWGILRYWFRGVEQFAPWVNRIHFITWGHLPDWLNTEHPKLHIVNHRDYIPEQYLPTFSSHTIELNMHRIEGLSEQFVYLNDDTFLLSARNPSDFFKNGLPCDSALMNPAYTVDLTADSGDNRIFYIPYNNTQYLNRRYDMRSCVKAHPAKWYSLKYGSYLMRNLLLTPWPRFVGFVDHHLPQPYLKQSFADAWKDSEDILDATCRNRIRTDHDVNQWYIRYRQLAEGKFAPIRPYGKAIYYLSNQNEAICKVITAQQHPMICINDGPNVGNGYLDERTKLQDAFKSILPEKSSFER